MNLDPKNQIQIGIYFSKWNQLQYAKQGGGKGESFNDNAGWEFQYDADEMNVKTLSPVLRVLLKHNSDCGPGLLANSVTQAAPAFLSVPTPGFFSSWVWKE